MNTSYNMCYRGSGAYLGGANSNGIETHTNIIHYSNFVYGTNNNGNCILLYWNRKYEINHCNILHNTPTHQSAVFYIYGSLTIQNCCILNNTDLNLFMVEGQNQVTFKDSYFDGITINALYSENITNNEYTHDLIKYAHKYFNENKKKIYTYHSCIKQTEKIISMITIYIISSS